MITRINILLDEENDVEIKDILSKKRKVGRPKGL